MRRSSLDKHTQYQTAGTDGVVKQSPSESYWTTLGCESGCSNTSSMSGIHSVYVKKQQELR
jgi:hypothetical protein